MPLLRLVDEAGSFFVDLRNRQLPLAVVLELYLSGRLALRPTVAGVESTSVALLRYSCWRCRAESTVWKVGETSCVGRCGTEAVLGYNGSTMWAEERPEQDRDVMRAAAMQAGVLGWPGPAGIGSRYTQTTGTSYVAFSCPACGSVFGDFPVRSAWMEAAYEDDMTALASVNHGPRTTRRAHWCRDTGAGLCG